MNCACVLWIEWVCTFDALGKLDTAVLVVDIFKNLLTEKIVLGGRLAAYFLLLKSSNDDIFLGIFRLDRELFEEAVVVL